MTTQIRCRAILFDMDGTLVDSTVVVEAVWARFAERFGLDLATILESSHGRRMDDSILRFGPEGVDVAEVGRDLSEFEYATTEGVPSPGPPTSCRACPQRPSRSSPPRAGAWRRCG